MSRKVKKGKQTLGQENVEMLLSLNNYELYPAGTSVLLIIGANKIDSDETSFKSKSYLVIMCLID